jgi:polysaccharide export outer membrane protein
MFDRYSPNKQSILLITTLCAVLGFTLSPATPALAAVPDIPPSVLAQLKTMSPAEQAALARQYGFELPQNTGLDSASQGGSAVGNPGSEVTAFDRTQQLQLEAKVRAQIAEDEGREQGKELKRFGLDLFDQEVSTFAPVDDMPAPDGYRVGPGDTINVYLYGNEEVDVALAVSRDGQLILPRLGPISVTGLTFEEVRELIIAKVSAQLVGTEAVVSMGKLRSINVFLAGDVVAPGSYSVSGLSTVLQVLFSGGGVTDIGSLRQIQVKRRGKVVEELDAYDILLRGDTSGDIRLASGDTVFVPTVDRLVTIDGEVKRPAIYEVLPSETLGNLLEMAGGLNASGYAKSASIRRFETGRSSTTRIQFDLTDRKDLNALLFDGDYLNVDSIKEEVSNQVLLRGAVARPGGYEWFEGQRISDLIGSVEEDLLTETDLSTGLLVRRTGRGLEIETLAFDLGEIVASRGSAADFELRVKDEVLVFALPYLNESYQKLTEESVKSEKQKSVFEDRTDLVSEVVFRLEAQAKNPSSTQIVEIAGDVRLPGKYPLLENRNIDALIRLAGGFENSAYLTSAEVTRINFTSEGTARVASFKVPLVQTSEYQAFELKPLDQVRISRIPNWSYGDAVELTGSLVFPGSYPIVPGEKLSSLVSRAGGIAENGFPQGAVLIKVEAKEREQAQLEKLIASIQRTALAQSQTREQESNLGGSSAQADLELLEDLLQSDAGGRVVIDLPAILAGDPSADIQLEAGDSLFVPEFNSTISVIGEVRQPGTFRFDTDRRVNDYIEQAAGATVRADLKVAYVVRANGKVDLVGNKSPLLSFRSSRASDLQPGDTIVVPVNEEYQPVLARYKEVSTVIFQSVASLYPLFRL